MIQEMVIKGVMVITEDLRERHYAHLKSDPEGLKPEKSEVQVFHMLRRNVELP